MQGIHYGIYYIFTYYNNREQEKVLDAINHVSNSYKMQQ